MMRQEYLNQMNYMGNQQKIKKKGCGCGNNKMKKTAPQPMPSPIYNPLNPQHFKR